MIIAVDFDGTVVTHEFPKVGKDIGAVPVLKRLVEAGHQLVLFTMRSDSQEAGNVLSEAVDWFVSNEISLYGVNVNPDQLSWTKSPKAYAELYIDDAALGCPLAYDHGLSNRYYVDWKTVEWQLEALGILKPIIIN